jgi:hypothetical protein
MQLMRKGMLDIICMVIATEIEEVRFPIGVMSINDRRSTVLKPCTGPPLDQVGYTRSDNSCAKRSRGTLT